MDATAELTRALAEWRRLTDLEGEAILGDNWREVARQQSRKARLQEEIRQVLGLIHSTSSNKKSPSGEVERQFGSTVSQLLALERRNRDLLAAKRDRRRADSERLTGTLRDLHGVRRAYGFSDSPHWHSYS